ncbi:hypothetical protein D1AOALGA4SA_9123 [Olavius algarvensis Delta 1 endosymbiont]|nr:hypothetical protein D1AOALGA4SA_9123 [Olavius algarvensis Delta 1 endosymbiont]
MVSWPFLFNFTGIRRRSAGFWLLKLHSIMNCIGTFTKKLKDESGHRQAPLDLLGA